MIRSNSTRRSRRGFTLIELLVVMGLIATLAAVAMVVAPGVMEKDRSVDAVNSLEGWLQISRARAQRDRLPRGIRLIIDQSKPNPLHVTEVQYIESPPVFLPNPDGPSGVAYAQFNYTFAPVSSTTTNPPAGTITDRQFQLRMMTPEQRDQIRDHITSGRQPSIWLPTLGTWHRMTGLGGDAQEPAPNFAYRFLTITLDQYPDAQLGAAGLPTNAPMPQPVYRTPYFGIYNPPRPLLGESPMLLPTNTAVDLSAGMSFPGVAPPPAPPPVDYDILFAPNGQLAVTSSTAATGHLFLLVREPRKLAAFNLTIAPPNVTYNDLADFQRAGEMMVVAVKGRGAIGAGPVNWPDAGGNVFPTNYDPYAFARKAVAGP